MCVLAIVGEDDDERNGLLQLLENIPSAEAGTNAFLTPEPACSFALVNAPRRFEAGPGRTPSDP